VTHKITLEFPDDVYERVAEAAARISLTPEEYIVAHLRALTTLRMPAPSAEIRKFAGAVSIADPRGYSNEVIDDDLGKEYGDPHENDG
jgi:hypothetical protein